jgi:hypothetical protein
MHDNVLVFAAYATLVLTVHGARLLMARWRSV